MNYSDISELCKTKNIKIKDILSFIGYSRGGLEFALNNETIELRKLKLLCDYMRISPANFFDTGTFGVMINAGGNVQSGNNNRMSIESKDREIELLKEQIRLKDEIINLLKSK